METVNFVGLLTGKYPDELNASVSTRFPSVKFTAHSRGKDLGGITTC